jgi:hypothetical protein
VVERMGIGLWRGMAHGPGTLISSQVFVWQIIASRIGVLVGQLVLIGGSGVVAGVVETPWTGSANRDKVRQRDAASSANAGLDGRGESA